MKKSREYCVFCKILEGQADASLVYRDQICSIYMEHQPVTTGHIFIMPNEHIAHLEDLPEETGAHMFNLGQRAHRVFQESKISCEGVNFFLSDGEAASQEIFHVHLNVFPRHSGDQFHIKFPEHDDSELPSKEELDELAIHLNQCFQEELV